MAFVWVLTLICSLASGAIIMITLGSAHSAPQEAAGFAMACAVSVVPYVFCRSAQAIFRLGKKDGTDRIVQAIEDVKNKIG